jgi:endonuclease/exonuclease/phosphatase family metal-dependent hydrolase
VPAAALAVAVLSACATARNYPDPEGPRFHGEFAARPAPATIKVVTLNLKYSKHTATAVQLLRQEAALRDADVVALQEMDDAGSADIARALSLNYVYYPGALHPKTKRNFGNTILTRWPIEADAKLLLPHPGRFRKMVRIAVAATIRIRDVPVRFYSVHLETPVAVSGDERREQTDVVVKDAAPFDRVIVAGDFNNEAIVAQVFRDAGYRWITRDVKNTISKWRWDHIFARGFQPRDFASVGVLEEKRDVSDHKPVWAELVLE